MRFDPSGFFVRRASLLFAVAAAMVVAGCGGGSSSAPPPLPPAIAVTVAPPSPSVTAGQTQQFTATVANTTNTAVTWQVNGTTGGDSAHGTISASGMYTAPAVVPSPATVTITAVSQADATKSGSAAATVMAPPPAITVTVTPATPSVATGQTVQFAAAVANTANTAVTWQVNGTTGGDSTHGTVSASGMYTAPAVVPSPATVTITAVSQADTTKSGSATATVTAPPAITVTVTPPSPSVITGQTVQFAATVANTANTAVTWQVNGTTGGDSTHGTISASGLFTAPAAVPSPATVTITAVSQADTTKSGSATATITAPPVISVSVTPSAPSVQTGQTQGFTATVSNDTQNKGVTWSLSGAGCSGATCGSLSGTTATSVTYTAPGAVPSPATVTLTAQSVADGTKSAAATITVSASTGTIAVTVSPVRTGITTAQTLSVTAAVANDSGSKGVSWTSSGGTLSNTTTTSASFSATTAGVYTITATSVTDGTKNAVVTVGVTDLAGVLTYHNDLSRDGVNAQEYALTPANVSAHFGKLFSCQADGAIYAQPLWVPNVVISGVQHNVIIAATQNDSVYAFDADANPCVTLWHANLLDAAHKATAGETPVPSGLTGNLVGNGDGDIVPQVGVTGTPVIDASTGTIYVVAKSVIAATSTFFQRLHALDLTSGAEKLGGPAVIGPSGFNLQTEHDRAGLVLSGGLVYVSWASHEDAGGYHGWVVSYNAATLAQVNVFNTTPNGNEGGIWMSGGAPSVDAAGNLYAITGNGTWDGLTSFGDSFLKMTPALSLSDWFTPSDQANDNINDLDFGAGGATVLIDQSSGPAPHLVMGGGKDGALYILNRGGASTMGHFGDANAWQLLALGGQSFFTPVFWQNTVYVGPVNRSVAAYPFDTGTDKLSATASSASTATFGFPGTTPSVSSSRATNGIVWALDNSNFGANFNNPTRVASAAVLHAWDATNLATELWNSSQGTGNTAGNAVKFTVPTIANGKVYIGTRGNDDSIHPATVPGEIDVYGLQ